MPGKKQDKPTTAAQLAVVPPPVENANADLPIYMSVVKDLGYEPAFAGRHREPTLAALLGEDE